MKNLFLILITLIIGFSSCEKPTSKSNEFPDGTYFGTFQRNLISGEAEKANISITFSSGIWSGQSDMQHYPALCNGTYKIENDKLIFTNDCIWTAEFDWSFILSGEYKFAINGDSLAITKDYGNPSIEVYTDLYCLSLPKNGIKKSPMVGTWVESISGTDTIVFAPEYDGQFPIFNLNRKFRVTEGYTLPGYFSGPYWYILGKNSISINWFLSSNSAFNRYCFKLMPEGNQLKIGSFFTDPPEPLSGDTLTFIKIK